MIHTAVRELFESLSQNPAFEQAVVSLRGGEKQQLSFSGLTTTAKALYLVLLWRALERPLLIITHANKQAETLAELTQSFFDLLRTGREPGRPQLLPALDVLPHQNLSPHTEIVEQRAIALWRLAAHHAPITIAPVAAALQRIEHGDFYRQLPLTLRTGDELPLEAVVAHLESIGYEKRDPVELVGEYSLRGGILDVFTAEAERPLRVEFFGDFIESMRRFDVETQRSVHGVEEAHILPLVEAPRSRELLSAVARALNQEPPLDFFPGWEFFIPLVRPHTHSILHLATNALVVWDEPEQLAAAAERLWKRLQESGSESPLLPEHNYFHYGELMAQAGDRTVVSLRELELATSSTSSFYIPSQPAVPFHGNMRLAISESQQLAASGAQVVFFAPSTGEVERMADLLREYSIPFQLGLETVDSLPQYLAEKVYLGGSTASTFVIKGRVRRGVVFSQPRVAIFGSEDLFETSELIARQPASKSHLGAFAADVADLKPGDYVVHTTHGVGRFLGLRTISQGEQAGDFMLLEYAGGAKLYVPLTRLDLVQKYRGAGEGGAPPLDKLGGATWAKTKARVKSRMRDMAGELLRLYAERRLAEGFAFSKDSNWQREFEEAFEFTETRDQLTAIEEIKRDMESPHPMDRLLCGDVGFGKTEVAMRAAFKALGDGKQVAVLAPTTVLCLQHFETFKRRFAPFPVRVEMLSRLRTSKEIKAILEDLATGKVDIVIGTHRLLSQDVVFADLGLMIIDEEQRFGVRHKERLKQLKKNIDVLTMSATPIPRTLHMSLVGLRDMSVIETPPKDRLAIHTVVAHYDPALIRAAIEQELARGGQVYFIHNRIDSIYSRAASIQELVPQARIAVGHGQMTEQELERVLLGFMRHETDVLVCTTIVENGLDIPLANTIVIENAERYGLAELYQLRGRVGRSNRRAYAYLLVPPDAELSELARKRLAALKEFSDLGAGFKIAALDLELRGAGNILGGEQHGHIAAVGFDTYVRLLEETIQELRGVESLPEIRSTINLGLDLRIPQTYIADEHQRLRAYKRIAEARTPEEASRLAEELADRYGPLPAELRLLLQFAVIKSKAEQLGVEAIDRRGGMLNLKFHEKTRVNPQRLLELVQQTPGAQFTPAGLLKLPLNGRQQATEILSYLEQILTV